MYTLVDVYTERRFKALCPVYLKYKVTLRLLQRIYDVARGMTVYTFHSIPCIVVWGRSGDGMPLNTSKFLFVSSSSTALSCY